MIFATDRTELGLLEMLAEQMLKPQYNRLCYTVLKPKPVPTPGGPSEEVRLREMELQHKLVAARTEADRT